VPSSFAQKIMAIYKSIAALLVSWLMVSSAHAGPMELELNGSVSGIIISSDNKAAEEVSVCLKNESGVRSTTTNENGYFEFKGLTKGKYLISISMVGHETISKEFYIQPGDRLTLHFQLTILQQQLQEIVVDTKRRKLQIGKMNIPDHDLPLSTGIISHQIIKDQQITRLGDLVKCTRGFVGTGPIRS